METGRPFVVTVASEKGGVGKTTLATNLAVYLKALHEDLPVTILSFDNHFSVDNMFAIGARRGESVAGLFRNILPEDLVQTGEYGVQYLASERSLHPPGGDLLLLRRLFDRSRLGGIVILDTRPILDDCTRCALAAADLLLVPVKDRPSLVNAAAILDTFIGAGNDPKAAWIVPTLIDARIRLRGEVGVRDFLAFSAQERGYQVLEHYIAKSPKVEALATSLTSRVYPILTHARGSVVHPQMRAIAGFVLDAWRNRTQPFTVQAPAGRLRRLKTVCPLCNRSAGAEPVMFLHDQRSRQRGFLHAECAARLFGSDLLAGWRQTGALLVLDFSGSGLTGESEDGALRLCDGTGEEIGLRPLRCKKESLLAVMLEKVCGGADGRLFRDRLFIGLPLAPLEEHLADPAWRIFARLRKTVLKQLCTGTL